MSLCLVRYPDNEYVHFKMQHKSVFKRNSEQSRTCWLGWTFVSKCRKAIKENADARKWQLLPGMFVTFKILRKRQWTLGQESWGFNFSSCSSNRCYFSGSGACWVIAILWVRPKTFGTILFPMCSPPDALPYINCEMMHMKWSVYLYLFIYLHEKINPNLSPVCYLWHRLRPSQSQAWDWYKRDFLMTVVFRNDFPDRAVRLLFASVSQFEPSICCRPRREDNKVKTQRWWVFGLQMENRYDWVNIF